MPDMHNVVAGRQYLLGAAVAAFLILGAVPAWTQTCDARSPQTQFARDDLQRALTEADFAIVQDYSERARREMKQLAAQSDRCDCPAAKTKFEAGASQVGLALDSESRKDLREAIRLAVPPFDEAMKHFRECARR
jgi:hypothetical protein